MLHRTLQHKLTEVGYFGGCLDRSRVREECVIDKREMLTHCEDA